MQGCYNIHNWKRQSVDWVTISESRFWWEKILTLMVEAKLSTKENRYVLMTDKKKQTKFFSTQNNFFKQFPWPFMAEKESSKVPVQEPAFAYDLLKSHQGVKMAWSDKCFRKNPLAIVWQIPAQSIIYRQSEIFSVIV